MNKKALYIILAILVVMMIVIVAMRVPMSGLQTTTEVPNTPSEVTLINTPWVWQNTKNLDGSVTTPKDPSKFGVQFMADNTFTVTTDCNNGAGKYVVDGEILSLGEMMRTEKGCIGSQEEEFVSKLALTGSYVISGNTLTLNLNRDVGVMTFTTQQINASDLPLMVIDAPLPVNSLWAWTVTVRKNGQEVTSAENKSFQVTFGPDNKFTGTGDCNSYFGTYALSGKTGITISDVGMTLKFCEGSQESVFTGDLAKAQSYVLQGNMLRITLSDGSVMILARRPIPTT